MKIRLLKTQAKIFSLKFHEISLFQCYSAKSTSNIPKLKTMTKSGIVRLDEIKPWTAMVKFYTYHKSMEEVQ